LFGSGLIEFERNDFRGKHLTRGAISNDGSGHSVSGFRACRFDVPSFVFDYRLASQLVFRAENFIGAVSTLTEQSKDRNDTRCPAVRSH
jgi:hypothetical protein